MSRQPAADLGGILDTALVQPAIAVLAGGGVPLGFGMAQQDQTAHGAILGWRARAWSGIVYKLTPGKVTDVGTVTTRKYDPRDEVRFSRKVRFSRHGDGRIRDKRHQWQWSGVGDG